MALKSGQSVMALETLYNANVSNAIPQQLEANLEIVGGTVTLYGSQVKPASPPTGMEALLTGVVGLQALTVVPNYLYAHQASGTTTSLIISGVDIITPAT